MNKRIKQAIIPASLAMLLYMIMAIFVFYDVGFVVAGGFGVFIGNFIGYYFILLKPSKTTYSPPKKKTPNIKQTRKKKLNKIFNK